MYFYIDTTETSEHLCYLLLVLLSFSSLLPVLSVFFLVKGEEEGEEEGKLQKGVY